MYSPFRYAQHAIWKHRPVQLTFFVTRRCNASCPFCFYLQAQEPSPSERPELALGEIEKMVPSLGRLLWVAFSGGEVYLRDDIVDISRAFYAHSRPAILLFPTNGLMPETIKDKTEEILRGCPRSVVAVKLSMDGLYGEHDSLRGVPGAFDKMMATCDMLGGLAERYPNLELGINTVFCSANEDRVGDILAFTKGLSHIRTHTLSMVRGQLSDESYKDVDLRKYHEAVTAMEAEMKTCRKDRYRFLGARLKSAQDILQRRLIHQTLCEKKRLLPCYAGRLNLVVTESGDVYPCEVLNARMGNVREHGYDIRKLLRSGQAAATVARIQARECYCSHECNFITNILFNPVMYPALLREYARLK